MQGEAAPELAEATLTAGLSHPNTIVTLKTISRIRTVSHSLLGCMLLHNPCWHPQSPHLQTPPPCCAPLFASPVHLLCADIDNDMPLLYILGRTAMIHSKCKAMALLLLSNNYMVCQSFAVSVSQAGPAWCSPTLSAVSAAVQAAGSTTCTALHRQSVAC